MVAQLLRLKLQLLANAFRRRPLQLVGMLLSLLYGMGFALVIVVGLVLLRGVDPMIARSIVVSCGSGAVLGFFLLPLAFGVDDTVDARKFAVLGIATTKLSAGLLVAALLSVPSLVITTVALTQIVTWSRGVLPTVLAILSGGLIVATCVIGARVSTAIAAFLLSSRRARDTTGIISVILVVALAPAFIYLASVDWSFNGLNVLARIANAASWTPLGAVWAAPADAAVGSVGTAWLKLLIAIAFVGLLWLGWRALTAKMLVTPQRQAVVKTITGLGWFGRFRGTPTGAIAARSLIYWSRDARYRVSLIIVPIVPILPVVALAIAGVHTTLLALVPVPIMLLFLAWSTLHNDVAYDDTAVWLHLASGTTGRQDRWGRAIPVLLVGLPLAIVGSLVSTQIWGNWQWFPSIFGLNVCILFTGIGLSSLISVRFPYPVVKPGDSPFAQPQASGTASSLIQSLSFFALLLLAVPVIGLAALGALGDPLWHVAALGAGLAIGLAGLFGGVGWGGRVFDRRAPELLEFTARN